MRRQEPSSFNLVSLLMLLFVVGVAYLGWKYVPVYWQKQQIQEMMMSEVMLANRRDDDKLREQILRKMAMDFGYEELLPEDVEISRTEGWIEATVYYQVNVEHYYDKVHSFVLTAHIRRRVINL